MESGSSITRAKVNHQHERTPARRCAVQILYSGAIRNSSSKDLLDAGDLSCLDDEVTDYAYSLVEGVEANKDALDAEIESAAENWTVKRMPYLDLAILRCALYEMMFVDAVPLSVSINEAVEIAKSFGGEEDSPKFVNGILGTIARRMGADGSDTTSSNSNVKEEAVIGEASSETA